MTVFMNVKSVLDSGATDSCAPDCMCPEVKQVEEVKCTQPQAKLPIKARRTSQWSLGQTRLFRQIGRRLTPADCFHSSVRQICIQGNRVLFGAQSEES